MVAPQPRMRPRFEVELSCEGAEVFSRLREGLARGEESFRGEVLDRHAYLRLPPDRRSLLSPSLNLELAGEDGRRLVGRFTPHPTVWTGFMTVFAALGVIGFAGSIYGFAQLTVHVTPWAFWIAPICASLFAFVYGASFIGQGLSNAEMYALRAFLDSVIREAEEASRGAVTRGDSGEIVADPGNDLHYSPPESDL